MRSENRVGVRGKWNKSVSDRGKSKAKAWINLKCWVQGVEYSLQKIPFREFSRSQGGVQFQKPPGEIQAQFGCDKPGLDKIVGHYLPALCVSRRAALLPSCYLITVVSLIPCPLIPVFSVTANHQLC